MNLKAVPRRMRTERTGASSVEFALVFPIILMFFVAMIAMTQAFLLKDMTQHAAYEGVRRGIVLNATPADAIAVSENFMNLMRAKGATVTVTPSFFDNSTREISIEVQVPMNQNAWIAAPFMPSNWVVGSKVTIAKRND